jgi:hypothetical protein
LEYYDPHASYLANGAFDETQEKTKKRQFHSAEGIAIMPFNAKDANTNVLFLKIWKNN